MDLNISSLSSSCIVFSKKSPPLSSLKTSVHFVGEISIFRLEVAFLCFLEAIKKPLERLVSLSRVQTAS